MAISILFRATERLNKASVSSEVSESSDASDEHAVSSFFENDEAPKIATKENLYNYFEKIDDNTQIFNQLEEQQEQDEGKESDDQGNTISKCTISVTRTDYIMVPENYDGLLMSVYVADWVTERQNDDNENNDKPNRKPVQIHDPMPFDDEENIDDYVFFGISRSK